jgi:hypothetical protein
MVDALRAGTLAGKELDTAAGRDFISVFHGELLI